MTLNIKIDGARALDLLASRVKDREGYVYQRPGILKGQAGACVYQHGGSPSCLVGCALFDAGVSVGALRGMDTYENTSDTSIDQVDLPEGLEITPKAMDIFAAAQMAQDFGKSWGHALNRAIEAAADFGPEEAPEFRPRKAWNRAGDFFYEVAPGKFVAGMSHEDAAESYKTFGGASSLEMLSAAFPNGVRVDYV